MEKQLQTWKKCEAGVLTNVTFTYWKNTDFINCWLLMSTTKWIWKNLTLVLIKTLLSLHFFKISKKNLEKLLVTTYQSSNILLYSTTWNKCIFMYIVILIDTMYTDYC